MRVWDVYTQIYSMGVKLFVHIIEVKGVGDL